MPALRKKGGNIKVKQPVKAADDVAKSSNGGIMRPIDRRSSAEKIEHLRTKRLRSRNLYLIKETLSSFGIIQLPIRLDVLRRVLYCTLIQKMDQKSAIEKVCLELVQLYGNYHIDAVKMELIQARIKALLDDYTKILEDAEYIKALNYNQKKEMQDRILDTFKIEFNFANQLGFLFECYDENALQKLSLKNNMERFQWFRQQLAQKSTGLAIPPIKRYADLMKQSK